MNTGFFVARRDPPEPAVYTALAQMPWPLLDLKRHFDLIVASELLMVERRG